MTTLTLDPAPTPAARSAAPDEPARGLAFRSDIEGLRAVAVLLVVLYHAGVPFLPGGYIGVDVFFVLSGFLITGLLVREQLGTDHTSFRSFYARRVRRLLPLSTLVLLVTVAASFALLGPVRAADTARDGVWTALFLANVRFAATGTNYLVAGFDPSPLQHYWSLAVEEQFYLVWPAFIAAAGWLARGRDVRRVLRLIVPLVLIASLALSVTQTAANPTAAFFSPFTRVWELAAGGLLALWLPELRRVPDVAARGLAAIGLVGIVAAAVVIDESTAFPGIAAAWPVLATVVVLAGGTATSAGVTRLLGVSPMQWIGRLSYGWYLWHWPLLVLAVGKVGRDLPIAANLVLVTVALGLAVVTHRLVEDPVRFAPWLRARAEASLVFGGALVMASLLIIGVVVVRNGGLDDSAGLAVAGATEASVVSEAEILDRVAASSATPAPGAPVLRPAPEAIRQDLAIGPKDPCLVPWTETSVPECVFGEKSAARVVVLYGDSHAAQWLPALDAAGRRLSWKVVLIAKASCSIADTTTFAFDLKRNYDECDRWRPLALERISQLHPELVVVAGATRDVIPTLSDGSPRPEPIRDTWKERLPVTLNNLSHAAEKVVLLGDTPYTAQDPAECVAAHRDDLGACATPRDEAVVSGRPEPRYDPGYDDVLRTAARSTGATFVSVVPWLCSSTTCPMVIGDTVAYRDRFHIGATYSRELSASLADAVGME